MKRALVGALIVVLGLSCASVARADSIDNAEQGLSTPDVLQDFGVADALGNQQLVEDDYEGLTFVDGWQYLRGSDTETDGFVGSWLGNPADTPESSPDAPDTATLVFDQVVTDVSFLFESNAGETTFTALLDGEIVDQYTIDTSSDRSVLNYFGFTGIEFDTLEINAPANHAFHFDSLAYNLAAVPVPEPSTLALLALGLTGLAWRRRRRTAGRLRG